MFVVRGLKFVLLNYRYKLEPSALVEVIGGMFHERNTREVGNRAIILKASNPRMYVQILVGKYRKHSCASIYEIFASLSHRVILLSSNLSTSRKLTIKHLNALGEEALQFAPIA